MNAMLAEPTIGAAVLEAAQRWPHATAYFDQDRPSSYADIDAVSDRLACGLIGMGLAQGNRIGVLALNQIEWLQLFFAAAKIGIGVVGLSPRYRDADLEHMLRDSEVKAVFTLAQLDGVDFLAMMERLAPSTPDMRHVVPIGAGGAAGATNLATLAHTAVDDRALAQAKARVRPDDLAMVIYTSGTTGRPKGAALTHRTMLSAATAQTAHTRAGPEDLLQLALPFNHVGGITCGVLAQLLAGGTCELVPVFKAEAVLKMMARRPPTIVVGVPTMLTLLVMSSKSTPVDLQSVRLIITGGSNADSTLLKQLQQFAPNAKVMNLYGASEASGTLVMSPWDCSEEELMASIGRPLQGAEMRVVSADGRDAAPGDVGELWFRGLGVVSGYVGGTSNADAFDSEGWLHTGDLASVDARGLVYLRGRKKDMYIQGGFNVYPAEVESFIAQHPKVMMVAGIGVADPVLGEVGRYYIIAKPGSGLTEQEVLEHCAKHLADYKVPRQIVLRAELPLTPVGKVNKTVLRTEAKS